MVNRAVASKDRQYNCEQAVAWLMENAKKKMQDRTADDNEPNKTDEPNIAEEDTSSENGSVSSFKGSIFEVRKAFHHSAMRRWCRANSISRRIVDFSTKDESTCSS